MDKNNSKTIYLAGGCFWGTERLMQLLPGIISTTTGYANSLVEDPSYKQVCTGTTNAAETVKVEYDPNIIDLATILGIYFKSIDPTSINKQGGDIGTQYRTGIFYIDSEDLPTIERMMSQISTEYVKPIVVEVKPLMNFYSAEDYHQDYLINNPGGYCHVTPRIFNLARSVKPKA